MCSDVSSTAQSLGFQISATNLQNGTLLVSTLNMASDMENIVNAFKNDGVNFVFGCTRLNSCIQFVKTSKSKDFNVLAASLSACLDFDYFVNHLGSDASYYMGPQIWSSSNVMTYLRTNYTSKNYYDDYYELYNDYPVYQGAAAFALPFILLDAVTKAGTASNVTRIMSVLKSQNYSLDTTYGK